MTWRREENAPLVITSQYFSQCRKGKVGRRIVSDVIRRWDERLDVPSHSPLPFLLLSPHDRLPSSAATFRVVHREGGGTLYLFPTFPLSSLLFFSPPVTDVSNEGRMSEWTKDSKLQNAR
jgi:hypothetical protein